MITGCEGGEYAFLNLGIQIQTETLPAFVIFDSRFQLQYHGGTVTMPYGEKS